MKEFSACIFNAKAVPTADFAYDLNQFRPKSSGRDTKNPIGTVVNDGEETDCVELDCGIDASREPKEKPKSEIFGKFTSTEAKGGNAVQTFKCKSGIFGWTGKFDAEFKGQTLFINTKVKLINRQGAKPVTAGEPVPEAGDTVTEADKNLMKFEIEGKLSGKWMIHRAKCQRGKSCDCNKDYGCCKFKVSVTIEFVESGEYHIVNLFQGAGRANSENWTRVKTRPNSWAHETGHLLGFYDEYEGGAVGSVPRWKVPNPTAVMSSGLDVPYEYYWDFRDWFSGKTGENWDGIASK